MVRFIFIFGPFIIFLAVIVWVVGGALAVTLQMMIRARHAQHAAWQAFARGTKLMFKPAQVIGDPIQLNGIYRKRTLFVLTFATDPQDHHTTYTRIALDISNPNNVTLKLRGRGIFDPIERTPNTNVVEVGNTAFDRRFFIESQPTTAAQKIFTSPYIRQRLKQQDFNLLEINDHQLVLEKFGALHSAENLQALFNLLSDIADAATEL